MQHPPELYLQLLHAIRRQRKAQHDFGPDCFTLLEPFLEGKRVRIVALLLDLLTQVVLSRPDDTAALATSTNSQDDGSMNKIILIAFNNDPDDPLAVTNHIQTVLSLLGTIAANDPSSQSTHDACQNLGTSLYQFSWLKLVKRVNQYRHTFATLEDLFRRTADTERDRFSIEERTKYESLFRAITTILRNIPDTDEGNSSIKPSECFILIRNIFSSLQQEGIFVIERSDSDGMLNIQVPLSDKLEEFAAGALPKHQLFSVQRWLYKIFSLECLALRLVRCCQLRFGRSLLGGPFDVQVLRSAVKEPDYHPIATPLAETIWGALREAMLVHTESNPELIQIHMEKIERQTQFVDYILAGLDKGLPVVDRHDLHCELTLLKHIHERSSSKTFFPYIGTSKISCVGCSKYLSVYSSVTGQEWQTQGTDENVYPFRMCPSIDGGPSDKCIREGLVKELQAILVSDFGHWVDKHTPKKELWSATEDTAWLYKVLDLGNVESKQASYHYVPNAWIGEWVNF